MLIIIMHFCESELKTSVMGRGPAGIREHLRVMAVFIFFFFFLSKAIDSVFSLYACVALSLSQK